VPVHTCSKLGTLKKRGEFLRVRGGGRATAVGFVLEGKVRAGVEGDSSVPVGARFGFTITKKIGNAVVRNRIRRRLKASLGTLVHFADPLVDYVVVARLAAADQDFAVLTADLAKALDKVHAALKKQRRAGPAPG
jgi:ribonuclease P protein component